MRINTKIQFIICSRVAELHIYICAIMWLHTMLRKTASLSVSWKAADSPPEYLQELLDSDDLQGTFALVHRHDFETDGRRLLQGVQRMEGNNLTRMTLSVISPTEYLAGLKCSKQNELQRKQILKDAFHFLREEDFTIMELEADCGNSIVVYSGRDEHFMPLKGNKCVNLGKLKKHPMFADITRLSNIALSTFGCRSNFETVTTKQNVIYVALLYMDNTPAYYVGKATGGITNRWCDNAGHCEDVNDIIRSFTCFPGCFELVVHHYPCHLAIAGAVLKQVVTGSADGVALFAIDFCPKGKIMCCNREKHKYNKKKCDETSERPAIDHYEQHYIRAFEELFPDSDTEPKMKCLNAILTTCSCHHCSDGNLHGCSTEVALSLLLHDLQLA